MTPLPPRQHPPGYELLGELGRGGMGVVYQARQTGLNRLVALKMVPGADPVTAARFLIEADALAAVRHPNVVTVYDYGDHAGQPFLAMEFLPGGSLAEKLRDGGPLPPRAAADLVARVAAGVAAAHEQGVVHRDLKPGNVLFDAAGNPKVADFGVAKRGTTDLTRTGAVVGTPAYMAPEQARGGARTVGAAADVYALGVVLYECLSGRRPFEADDPVALLIAVAEDEAPPLRRLAPAVPRELEAVCRRCLAKDPSSRYPSAAALADDLQRFLNGERVSAVRWSALDRVRSNLGYNRGAGEFVAYTATCYWLAALMLAGETFVTLCVAGHLPEAVVRAANVGRLVLVVGLIADARRRREAPPTANERHLAALGVGYLACCTGNWLGHRLGIGWDVADEPRLYQTLALLTALAFFAAAPALWGRCYLFGAVFLGLSVAMAAEMTLAPLAYGVTWAAVLVAVGRRLQRGAAGADGPVPSAGRTTVTELEGPVPSRVETEWEIPR